MSRTKFELDFPSGYILSNRFVIQRQLGKGWEGEVYSVQEISTGIERAAKFFYPFRNKNNQVARSYAKKLHKLRHCSILISYLTQEQVKYRGQKLSYLISEYVEGQTLDQFLKKQKGNRLQAFQALHLFYALVKGIEEIHAAKEYHGDIHTENIIVRRHGLNFDLKLIDMFYWGAVTRENMRDDVFNAIRVLYDSLGGVRHYRTQPKAIKSICCGLKRSLLSKKFRTAAQLRTFIENLNWEES